MFAGVTQIALSGGPGRISGQPGAGLFPIICGDSDPKRPELYAAAGNLGAGRVLAIAHEGLLANASNSELDTARFNTQALTWLDVGATQQVGVLSGHGEFVRASNMTTLGAALTGAGWTVSDVPGTVTAATLSGFGAIIIGNAWGSFTAAEIADLEAFVRGGGGLYMAGLGWSWRGTLDTYPMNLVAAPYGISWIPGFSGTAGRSPSGALAFATFYPNCSLQLPEPALAHLQTVLAAHPGDLDTFLRGSATEADNYMLAAGQVALYAELHGGAPASFDLAVRTLMTQYPLWLGMAGRFDPTMDGALAVARASLGAGVRSALPLDAARLAEVETALGINDAAVPPTYGTLLADHGMLLLDNRGFSAAHWDSIVDHMELIVGVPRDLERMTSIDEWSTTASERSMPIVGLGVNVFGAASIGSQENQFPPGFPARSVPTFSSTVVHEVAHVVDSYMSRNSTQFAATKAALLTAAGLDDLNYLRSQVGAQFFQSAPQEFVASLANQWCTGSIHTLRLGLQRFTGGRQEPIKQALFMAETYSVDGLSTPLFDMDTAGRTTAELANLVRDAQGRITGICSPTFNLQVRYDASGNVTSVVERTGGCGAGWADLGSALAGTNGDPILLGIGDVLPGDPIGLVAFDGLEGTVGALVVGATQISAPLFGGTLVPFPGVAVPVVLDAAGELRLFLRWPQVATTGLASYFQLWVVDGIGPAGFAATNGLSATTQ
ncbi:MAG: hypothetical protein AAF628_24785 [Planctomycetota bacterium]